MSHGTDVAVIFPPSTACVHPWCDGIFCATADNGERFHRGILSSEGSPTESIGVELVGNDFTDGTSTGPLIDVSFTNLADAGVAQHSVGLTPDAALRHAAAVTYAATVALSRR